MKKKLLLNVPFVICLAAIIYACAASKSHIAYHPASVQTAQERPQFIEQQPIKLVGIGDSLTEGVGDVTGKGYLGIIKEKLEAKYHVPVHLQNDAKKGLRSEQLLKRVKKKSMRQSIMDGDFIFISIGANDVMKIFREHFLELHLEQFEKPRVLFGKHLEEILKVIREANPQSPIFMIGLFNPYRTYFSEIVEINEIVQMWNNESKRVIRQFNDIYFIDTSPIFSNEPDKLLHRDHFHPNRKGYEKIAETVLNAFDGDLLLFQALH